MRILFLGSGEFAIPTLRSITHDGHEVVAVISQPDKPRGRGKGVTPTPVKNEAMELGLPVLTPENVNAPEVVGRIRSLGAELAYVAAFGQKIGAELLGAFPAGIVNLHGSLLPAYRGAAPIQRAVMNGEEETGVTVFRLVEKMDAGPVLVRRRTGIGPDETADELHDRLSRIGCDAVRATLEILQKDPDIPGEEQDHARATMAPKLTKAEGRIHFNMPARKLAAIIRGLWSWPGANCRFQSADGRRDEIVTLARAVAYTIRTRPAESPDEVGRINDMMRVQAADADLEILQIKPAGGRLMDWQDYVNGRHVAEGDRFVPIEPA
ncbi:MAG: methionyl-tRNA formyltransferase [Planctomycetota bacterium]|nr:MAG: methionyl-tRNA formyltransferase [Planctomycetota bacterium]